MDNINIDELMRVMTAMNEGFAKVASQLEKVSVVTEKTAEQEEKDLRKSIEQSAGYTRINGKLMTIEEHRIQVEAKLSKELETQFGASKKIASKQETAYKQQLQQLGYIIDMNGKLAKTTIELDAAQKKTIEGLRKKAAYEVENEKRRQTLSSDALKKSAEDIGKATWGVATGLAKGETSFSSLVPIVDVVGNAMAGLSKGLFSLIPFVGQALGSISETVIKTGVEVSKIALEMLDRSLKTFQELASVGALVSNGMTGLNTQLEQSGMSLDGFKRIVKENAGTLAAYGGTVGLGITKFTDALNDISIGEAGEELRLLGLNADSMGESMAAFLEQELRLGRGRNMNQKQLTEGTIQYIKELDLLSKTTGSSREDLQKQRDNALNDSRYRAAMEGVDESNEKMITAFIGQFEKMDPTAYRGAKDLASGAITSDAAGQTDMAFPELRLFLQTLKTASKEDLPKLFSEGNQMLARNAKNYNDRLGNTALFVNPGEGIMSRAFTKDVENKFGGRSMLDAQKLQETQIQKDAEGKAAGIDPLSKDVVKASREMDTLANSALQLANALLPYAADAVANFTAGVNKAIEEIKRILKEKNAQNLPNTAVAEQQRKSAEETQKKAEARLENTTPGSQEAREAQEDVEQARSRLEQARKIEDSSKLKEAQQARKAAAEAQKSKKQPTPTPTPIPSDGPSGGPSGGPSTVDPFAFIKFQGDRYGNKEKFDMLTGDTQDMFLKMIAEYGRITKKSVTITGAGRTLKDQQDLWDRTEVNKTPGLLPNGNPVARPGTSKHEVGKALDLNRSDVEELDKAGLLAAYGFKRLANDPPHIEKARFGGAFDGPESGYPVMMHGEEIAMPKAEFEAYKTALNSVTKSSIAGATSTTTMPTAVNESVNALKSLHSIMSDKFDQMINVMERSTDIQARLLNNSMV